MSEVTSYHNPNAPVYCQWIAYIVLDDGKLWGVYSTGATQEVAEVKIKTLWDSERAKLGVSQQPAYEAAVKAQSDAKKQNDPWANYEAPKHHLAGKVWLIHKHTREKCRVEPHVADNMLQSGDWERGGPRSK